MKLDIPYYIRQVLREQRKVYVPGIGTFHLVQSSASFNNDNTDLSPPQLNISFDDSESKDESLLKYILDTGELTAAKANKKIEHYTGSLFNKLLNVDSFLIDGIGTLSKRAGNDKVDFEPNVADLTKEFSDLRSLKMSPISRLAELNLLAQRNEVPPKVEDSGSGLLRILLLALLIIALYFLGMYLYNNYSNQPSKEKTEIIDQQANDEKSALAESNERELEQKYDAIDELIDPVNVEKDGSEQVVKLEEDKPSVEEKSKVGKDQVIDNSISENDILENLAQNEEIREDATRKSIGLPEADNTTPRNKHADIIPKSGECIIIVGSFIKSLNAIKMVSQLERRGYTVYQSEYKGFSRVGLKYECIDEDLEAYLQNIRKKISKKAWYLSPELVVPYQK